METAYIQVDQKKIASLLDQAYETRVSDLQKSIDLAQKALELSQQAAIPKYIAESLCKLSLFYMITGRNEEAINSARKAIEIFTELKDEKGIADAKYNIAGTYYKTDQFHLGLQELEECLIIYRKHKDYYSQARAQKSMGTIYEYFGDTRSATMAYESSVQAGLKCKNQDLVSNAYNPLSGILMKSGKKDEAIEMIEKSISIKKETGDIRGLAFAIYGRGKIHARLEQFEKAEADYNEALRIHIESGEKLGATMVQRKMAALYFQMGLLERAKETANLCLQSSGENNIALIKSDTYYLLYQISKIENDLENALNYLEAYTREKERIISERHHKMIKSYEITNRINTLEIEAESQREKAEIIEKKNQELDLFFHRVSHDLKGPIASLVSIDYVARSEIKDGKVHHFLDLARTQTTRINLILDELIKLTRVTHSTDAHEAIDFDKLISQCLMSFGSLPNFEKVRIEKSVASDLDFHAPWALVNTIVQNLLENGIKYARLDQEESFVKIKVIDNLDHIEIVVQDNGVGMRKDTGEKIFEMFYRAEKDIQGSGLGLYILNRAVEKLDGTISLESEPNVGSTFNVKLPKKQSL